MNVYIVHVGRAHCSICGVEKILKSNEVWVYTYSSHHVKLNGYEGECTHYQV